MTIPFVSIKAERMGKYRKREGEIRLQVYELKISVNLKGD